MTDPADVLDQWQRAHDPEPPREWGDAIPFQAESVPGGVGNEAADMYADLLDSGLDREFAAAMVDASYMTFAEWRTHHAA